MSGGSGRESSNPAASSSSSNAAQAAQAYPPVPSGPSQVQTYAAFAPGQQNALAQQMAQGFGGTLADHMNAMSFYRPTQAPLINTPSDIEAYLNQLRQSGQLAATPASAPQSSSSWNSAPQSSSSWNREGREQMAAQGVSSDEGRSDSANRYGRYR